MQGKIADKSESTNGAGTSSSPATVNFRELLARVDNDSQLLCELLKILKDELPVHLSLLEKAVAREDTVETANVSHTLKGMLANLCVAKSIASAARLEMLARSGETASFRDAFNAFAEDVQGLLPEMERYLSEAGP